VSTSKILIEHDGVKRELAYPFNICISRADMEHLVKEFQRALADEEWSYGWKPVHGPIRFSTAPGTLPRRWGE
jgi:hypothetical protein